MNAAFRTVGQPAGSAFGILTGDFAWDLQPKFGILCEVVNSKAQNATQAQAVRRREEDQPAVLPRREGDSRKYLAADWRTSD